MLSTKQIGNIIEQVAADYLEKNDLLILTRNFNCKLGEIDLIAKDKDILVFAEVRYKKNIYHGEPAATVNKSKQRKIINSAKCYLLKNNLYDKVDCRFDVIGITGDIETPTIEWFKDAFWADS